MKRMKWLAMLLVMILAFPAASMADEMEELRKEIRQMRKMYDSKIESMQKEINVLKQSQEKITDKVDKSAEEIALDIDYVGRYEGPFQKGGILIKNDSGFGNVSVGGYADIEYENFQDSTSTFNQHRWILNIGAELYDRLRFFSEYEIEYGGPDASGGGEAKVEQAYIDYLIADGINARAGAILVPFGRYNIYHDSDLQDLTARPLVDRRVIPTTWTESGAGIYGELNPTIGNYEDLILGYEAYVINGLDEGFSDAGMRGARGSIAQDNNQFKSMVGRLLVSPLQGHEFGFSGYYGEYDNRGNYIFGSAVDWFNSFKIPQEVPGVDIGPLEIIGEAAHFNIDETDSGETSSFMTGLYAQANLHFWPDFLDDTFLARGFEDPNFTLAGRYGWVKIDDDADAGTEANEEQRFTLGLNYRPIESWVFKLEYQWNWTMEEDLERGDSDGFMASVAMGF